MMVGGRVFRVSSFFPTEGTSTPTERMLRLIDADLGKETRQEITRVQREIDAMKRRGGELTSLFKRLYEDNVLFRIPGDHFRLLSSKYAMDRQS